MDLISLIVVLCILALVFWLVTSWLLPQIPAGPFRTVVLIIFVLICIVVLLGLVGIGPNLGSVKIGK